MRVIVFERKAARALDSLSPEIRQQVERDIIALALDRDSVAAQIAPLQGFEASRLRSGDWRIIFTENPTFVRVLFIGHRKDIYRKGLP